MAARQGRRRILPVQQASQFGDGLENRIAR